MTDRVMIFQTKLFYKRFEMSKHQRLSPFKSYLGGWIGL